MEGKFKTKKIMLLSGVLLAVMIFLKKSSQLITLPTKALLVKFPLNTHTPSVHPSQKNAGLHVQTCTKYCTSGIRLDPLVSLQHTPDSTVD